VAVRWESVPKDTWTHVHLQLNAPLATSIILMANVYDTVPWALHRHLLQTQQGENPSLSSAPFLFNTWTHLHLQLNAPLATSIILMANVYDTVPWALHRHLLQTQQGENPSLSSAPFLFNTLQVG
jgi:hypothetical protein